MKTGGGGDRIADPYAVTALSPLPSDPEFSPRLALLLALWLVVVALATWLLFQWLALLWHWLGELAHWLVLP